MKKKIALNINFDSLSECADLVGLSKRDVHRLKDPCYSVVMERFFKILKEFDASISIYLIGQDLEEDYIVDSIKEWRKSGVDIEIGNHSWSHPSNLGWLPIEEIEREVGMSHQIIENKLGETPVGFIAPAWSYSPSLINVLEKLSYKYDTSLAPSWLLDLSQLLLWMRSPGKRDAIPLMRGDFWDRNFRFFKKKKSSLLQAPLPTGAFNMAFWHTVHFQFPRWLSNFILKTSYKRTDTFYYLFHPLDLIDPEKDLKDWNASLNKVTRLSVPIEKNHDIVRSSLSYLQSQGAEFVTMRELLGVQ